MNGRSICQNRTLYYNSKLFIYTYILNILYIYIGVHYIHVIYIYKLYIIIYNLQHTHISTYY